MKRIFTILSLVGLMLVVGLKNVNAAELKEKSSATVPNYGTITVMETDGWEEKTDGGHYINQVYYVTSTKNGYVYLEILEVTNVKITNAIASSNFDIVHQEKTDTGVLYLLKAKTEVTGRTELFTIVADIVDDSKTQCNLSYSPMSAPVCEAIGELFFDASGNSVTREEYDASCDGYVPSTPSDVPSPDTGSVIPYIAIGGGIVAIVGVYLYSRKSNKVYKI